MASKEFHTYSVLFLYLAVVVIKCVTQKPLLPSQKLKISLGYPRDSLLNFTELTAKYGYVSEQHRVVTDDGYILTMFRITQAKNCVKKKRSPPVLLMHGLLQSSDSWIDSGPKSGLAYLISDACYDLWVGNERGNYYSRGHVRLDPDKDPEYWNFYSDEVGRYDLPALIDYVLNYTGTEKLNYIGFSQSTGTLLVMCSETPGYCEKTQLFIALAPVARQKYTKSFIYRRLTQTIEQFESELAQHGVHEVLPKGAFGQEAVAFFCQLSDDTEDLCKTIIGLFNNPTGYLGSESIAKNTTKVLFGHFPAGTSLHSIARYGQSTKSSKFEKFDYGKKKNVVVYGSEKPPKYNLSAVTVPVVGIYGKHDGLVDAKDVEWLMSKLPNVIEAVKVEDPLWNHVDVTYSQHTADTIFPKIMEYLLKYTHV